MGYTHYFENVKFSDANWKAFKTDVRKLYKTLDSVIQRESDDKRKPFAGTHEVSFNGVGEEGHETFVMTQENGAFDFCKTARKPYDLAVCTVLMLASYYCEEGLISSDGICDMQDVIEPIKWVELDLEWIDAYSHFKSVFPYYEKEKVFAHFMDAPLVCKAFK